MMTVTAEEAQNNLDALLDAVQHESIAITQSGQLVAMMLAPLVVHEAIGGPRQSTTEAFEAWGQRAAASALPAAAELTDEDVLRMVKDGL